MSNCVIVDQDMGESPDLMDTNLRKARKDWTCCECFDTIPAGSKYEHTKGLWDGTWSHYRTCVRCTLLAEDYFDGRIFTMMVELFQEEHGFDYRDGIPDDFTPCGASE